MQRRKAWKVSQPQRDVVHACLSLWFPGDLAEQMLDSRLVSLATEAPVGGLLGCVRKLGWGNPTD